MGPQWLWRPWPASGWRRTATVNTILVLTFTIAMTIFVAITSSKAGGINRNLIFFKGDCSTSTKTNLLLHLLLNIFSTCIIASSNFFMQILNAPSRSEVDFVHAHRPRSTVEIGVPSLQNIMAVSSTKTTYWVLFLLSSVPIHLFFNSAVFETEYQGADWNLTVAAEGFTSGAQYFPPGAILWPAGGVWTAPPKYEGTTTDGYGKMVNISEYFHPHDSPVVRGIDTTSASSGSWTRLEASECITQYHDCTPRTKYQDVILVVRSHNASSMADPALGWKRDDVLADMGAFSASLWDPIVPGNETNSLWFSAQCNTVADLNPRTYRMEGCFQTCYRAWGTDSDPHVDVTGNPRSITGPDFTFDFLAAHSGSRFLSIENPGLRDRSVSVLDLQYCLAQEVPRDCKLGLANNLLLVVCVCLVAKTSLCVTVLTTLRDEPLVTPGDAMVSFLTQPDVATSLDCTFDITRKRPPLTISGEAEILVARAIPSPVTWQRRRRRLFKVIPVNVWVRSYLLFAAVIGFTGWMLGDAMATQGLTRGNFFEQDGNNGILTPEGNAEGGLWGSVLLANSPQLLLSMSYFVYNSLFTRLQVEKEWNTYSKDYQPLRVTAPVGEQVSTYRLQLPYRYSIPLITISIILHWLVSNTLYVFIIEGGYYAFPSYILETNPLQGLGLSPDAYIGIGFSSLAILAVFTLACILILVPIALCIPRLKGDMVIGGSNSKVISAACHAIPVAAVAVAEPHGEEGSRQQRRTGANGDDSIELDSLLMTVGSDGKGGDNNDDDAMEEDRLGLVRLSRGKVRWGVVRSPEAYDQMTMVEGEAVGHLSFGAREHDVQPPVSGKVYA